MKREPIDFSIQLSARGVATDEIAVDDMAEAANKCLSYVDSLLVILSLVDADRLEKFDSTSLSITLEDCCTLGRGLCSQAMALIDNLEDARTKHKKGDK